MARNVVGVERLLRHHRLRRRHEGAIGRDLLRRERFRRVAVGIGPIVGESTALFLAQQRHRINKIGVKQRLMFDDRERCTMAGKGGAEQPEPISAAAAPLEEIKRNGRIDQATSRGFWQGEPRRERVEAQGSVAQRVEELELRAGDENLRIDEAGGKIEPRARAAPRQRPRDRVVQRPALKAEIGDKPVARVAPSLDQ